jgi:hypothetical protein
MRSFTNSRREVAGSRRMEQTKRFAARELAADTGALLMALGGATAAADRRYRLLRRKALVAQEALA